MNLQLPVLYSIVFLSGFAGLGYEMVWTRILSVGVGHEIVSVLAVVAAFFCGMALGAWCLGEIALTCDSQRTAIHWYAGIEAAIGCWSSALVVLIPWANQLAAQWMGAEPSPLLHWGVSFFLPFVLLLPATFAMGGTLPFMRRIFQARWSASSPIGGLYAANTFGAVAGTLLATFCILPWLGFQKTLLSFALINFFCAAGAICCCHRAGRPAGLMPGPTPAGSPVRGMGAVLFVTGFLGIGYEVLMVRTLSQVLENTVYSFACLLSVYLLGTACGAALYRYIPRTQSFEGALSFLLTLLSGFCLLGMLVLDQSEAIHFLLRSLAGEGYWGSIAAEMGLASAVFLLPTLAMGATFTLLAQKADTERMGFGGALCFNTLGGAVAPFVFGVLLLPLLGPKGAFLSVSAGYLALIPVMARRIYKPLLVPLSAGILLLISPFSLNLVTLEPGDVLLEHLDGVMASVTVVKDPWNETHLKINNRFQMGGTSSAFSDRREGHIPLLLHPNPRKALFLGTGTGGTLAAAGDHPGLRAVGVELVPEVIPMLHHFERSTGNLSCHPQLHWVVADARRYVNCSRDVYDVIVADLFHPARDGAGSLYTREHFLAIKARLNAGGIFCQWLPLYQMDLDVLRVIVRTFMEVFPDGSAFLAHYSIKAPILALISGKPAGDSSSDWWDVRTEDARLKRALQAVRLDNLYNFWGCFLASGEDLRQFAADAPLNTDDHPIVTFEAPRFAYRKEESAAGRLLYLLDRFRPMPHQVLASPHTHEEQDVHQRLAAYWKARNLFIHAGVGVSETSDVEVLVRSTREKLLETIQTSPDFTAAYFPLLAMAQQLYRRDPQAARALLHDLEKANPRREEARSVRSRLFHE
ncbi:fused MFS/spermidine synthase [Desulforhabdus sp. TSK]|uniref:fused MFS/spermidine synthase n=1 Tax=Desulforhabdus sp. TSK TaxID=2925014 RepID=UPI001FC8109E|nr:fused MFS/spermidine synthase [Desulforhabdus sp. TSK]GKT10165.1 hypothetical protein DSTSK_34700 [Desulforhabdus sp. TSK]